LGAWLPMCGREGLRGACCVHECTQTAGGCHERFTFTHTRTRTRTRTRTSDHARTQPKADMNAKRSHTARTSNTHEVREAHHSTRSVLKAPSGVTTYMQTSPPSGGQSQGGWSTHAPIHGEQLAHKGVGLHTHLYMGNSWHTRTRTSQRKTVDTHTRNETQSTHHAQHTETQHAPQTATRGYPTQSRTGSQPEGRQARRASLYITGCGRYRWRVVCVHPRPRRARPGCALPLACGVFPC